MCVSEGKCVNLCFGALRANVSIVAASDESRANARA